jgi:transposase
MSEQEIQKRNRKRTPNNRTTTGYRISDELWAMLQPLLPVHVNTHRFGGGRPRVPDRDCADAIFFAHSWMNRFRRLLIRWDKKPANYLAFLHFACGLIAFRTAGLFG